ncbi:MAG: phosphatase [Litorilinea sp.]|nr:MAG: phosphatase [Litorilinea sp.]
MVEAVILDRDGVLTYFDLEVAAVHLAQLIPMPLHQLAERWFAWGSHHGAPQNLAQEQQFFQEFWLEICQELGLPEAIRQQLVAFDYTVCVRPYPEVTQVLAALDKQPVRIGVLSNFALASLEASLEAAGLARYIDVACAAPVIGAAKPAPAAYLTVMERLGVDPADCLFVDDEEICVEGARAVGMRAYLMDRQRPDHDLAAHILRDLTPLPHLTGH